MIVVCAEIPFVTPARISFLAHSTVEGVVMMSAIQIWVKTQQTVILIVDGVEIIFVIRERIQEPVQATVRALYVVIMLVIQLNLQKPALKTVEGVEMEFVTSSWKLLWIVL